MDCCQRSPFFDWSPRSTPQELDGELFAAANERKEPDQAGYYSDAAMQRTAESDRVTSPYRPVHTMSTQTVHNEYQLISGSSRCSSANECMRAADGSAFHWFLETPGSEARKRKFDNVEQVFDPDMKRVSSHDSTNQMSRNMFNGTNQNDWDEVLANESGRYKRCDDAECDSDSDLLEVCTVCDVACQTSFLRRPPRGGPSLPAAPGPLQGGQLSPQGGQHFLPALPGLPQRGQLSLPAPPQGSNLSLPTPSGPPPTIKAVHCDPCTSRPNVWDPSPPMGPNYQGPTPRRPIHSGPNPQGPQGSICSGYKPQACSPSNVDVTGDNELDGTAAASTASSLRDEASAGEGAPPAKRRSWFESVSGWLFS